jgi:hypothetical protein
MFDYGSSLIAAIAFIRSSRNFVLTIGPAIASQSGASVMKSSGKMPVKRALVLA